MTITARVTISEFMTPSPHTIGLEQTLEVAHRVMREHQIRHLPVLDSGELVGMLSLRDLHFIETLDADDPAEVTIEEAMTPDPFVVGPGALLDTVAREMAEHKYGSAVVVDKGKVIGVFTTVDALRALAVILAPRAQPRLHPSNRAKS